jgi:hypothetical protein
LVIPGEESRNKQLREIQQLLASAPIVISIPGAQDVTRDPRPVVREDQSAPPSEESHGTRDTEHGTQSIVLPSVPVDQLLDDHAVEFEECKRWANSDAGQAARMTNPAGFANHDARGSRAEPCLLDASAASGTPCRRESAASARAAHNERAASGIFFTR